MALITLYNYLLFYKTTDIYFYSFYKPNNPIFIRSDYS